MQIAGYRGDGTFWCPACAKNRYGDDQVGSLAILDSAGEQVLPILASSDATHEIPCAGDCGNIIALPRPRLLAALDPEE